MNPFKCRHCSKPAHFYFRDGGMLCPDHGALHATAQMKDMLERSRLDKSGLGVVVDRGTAQRLEIGSRNAEFSSGPTASGAVWHGENGCSEPATPCDLTRPSQFNSVSPLIPGECAAALTLAGSQELGEAIAVIMSSCGGVEGHAPERKPGGDTGGGSLAGCACANSPDIDRPHRLAGIKPGPHDSTPSVPSRFSDVKPAAPLPPAPDGAAGNPFALDIPSFLSRDATTIPAQASSRVPARNTSTPRNAMTATLMFIALCLIGVLVIEIREDYRMHRLMDLRVAALMPDLIRAEQRASQSTNHNRKQNNIHRSSPMTG